MISPSMQNILRQDKELLYTLLQHLDESLRERHRDRSHLRFARPTDNGWSFFWKKDIAWDVLHDITEKAAVVHATCCSKGKIAEVLSQVVSMPEKEFQVLSSLVL